MIDDTTKDLYSRRKFLESGSAAIAAAGMLAADAAAQGEKQPYPSNDEHKPYPTKDDRSSSAPAPAIPNSTRKIPTPSSLHKPTQAASKPSNILSASRTNACRRAAGPAKSPSASFPFPKSIAGVDMRLTAGGVRELHWHTAGEWAIMLYGNARITGLDSEGKSFVDDVGEGDLWYFPTGIPHSIQGLEPDGCRIPPGLRRRQLLRIRNRPAHRLDGSHSQGRPRARISASASNRLKKLVGKEKFIFQAAVPGPLEADRKATAGTLGLSPIDFGFRASKMPPTKRTKGGEVRIVDSTKFKISTTMAAAIVTVHPGGIRELHWHQNADEWQYYMSGKGRMTVFATGGRARTMDFQAGDVGYIQKTLPHYIQNTGTTDLKFLEMFKSNIYQDLSLSQWLTHTPPDLVIAHLGIDRATYDALPKDEMVVMPG